MAKLKPKLTVTSYDLLDLSEDQLKIIFWLVCKVSGSPTTTYRDIATSLYHLIKEKTAWDCTNFKEDMIKQDYKLEAKERPANNG